MSKYTVQLRWVVEQGLTSRMAENIEANWPLIYHDVGLDDYPIFQEAYRETLNAKIIRHYYTREIGAETVGRWRMFVRDAMFLIMPYYNQLYESEILAKGMEPLGDRNISSSEKASGTNSSDGTSTLTGSGTSKGTSQSSANGSNQNVFQDTPQNEMIPDQIKQMKYATNVTLDENSQSANGQTTGEETSSSDGRTTVSGKYSNTVDRSEVGYVRPQAELLKLYRTTFLNIDNDIVHDLELAQCFMTIW